ncbi:MAG: hypothetical protein AAF092_11080 [Pseudomonadota bacterium]
MKNVIGGLVGAAIVLTTQFAAPAVAQDRLDFKERLGMGCKFRIYNNESDRSYWMIDDLDDDDPQNVYYGEYPGRSNDPDRQHFYVKPVESVKAKEGFIEDILDKYDDESLIWTTIQSGAEPGANIVSFGSSISNLGGRKRLIGLKTIPAESPTSKNAWTQLFGIEPLSSEFANTIQVQNPSEREAQYLTFQEGVLTPQTAAGGKHWFREVGCPDIKQTYGEASDSFGEQQRFADETFLADVTEGYGKWLDAEIERPALKEVALEAREYLPWTLVNDPEYLDESGTNNHRLQFEQSPWYVVERFHVAKPVYFVEAPSPEAKFVIQTPVNFSKAEESGSFGAAISPFADAVGGPFYEGVAFEAANRPQQGIARMPGRMSATITLNNLVRGAAVDRAGMFVYYTVVQIRRLRADLGSWEDYLDTDTDLVAAKTLIEGYHHVCWHSENEMSAC